MRTRQLYAKLTLLLLLSQTSGCSDQPSAEQVSLSIEWVALSGACFSMGENRIYPEERPVVEACVEPFEITATEITNGQYQKFKEATGYSTRAERGWSDADPTGPGISIKPSSAVFKPGGDLRSPLSWWHLVEGANWTAPEGPDSNIAARQNHPVVHLTREDAQAYASWAGGRLPTEAEWEYAARGGLDGALLAWEDVEHNALQDRANTWQGLFPVIDKAEDGYAGTAPVATYPANGFGIYDMVGNVWEWTSTPYAPSHNTHDRIRVGDVGHDPNQPGIPVGTIKGGSYLCAKSYCYRFRPAARQAQDLIFGTSHIGFRVVR